MDSKIKDAIQRKCNGYNCAQAVACTYCEQYGYKEEDMLTITSAFGSGMATMDGTCGAISGAGVIVGLIAKDKTQARPMIQEIMNKFKARNGVVLCKELKGIESGKVIRSCNDCVADAAEFLEDIINKL